MILNTRQLFPWLLAVALGCAIYFLPGHAERALFFRILLSLACLASILALGPWRSWRHAALAGERASLLLGPACLVLLAAGIGVRLADRAGSLSACELLSPFISEIMEGREVVKAWLLTQNQGIYTNLSDYPLLITLYGPLYSLLAAASTLWFGAGLFAARLVSVVAGVALGCVTGAMVHRLSGCVWSSLAAGCAVLLTPTMAYAAHARPDVLVWLTLFSGVYFLMGAVRDPRRMGLDFWGAVFFFVLAAFSKQSTWVFIAAGVGFCLWRRELRPLGLRLTIAVGAGCAVCLAGAQWATDGQFIRQTVLFPKRMSGLSSYNSFASAVERFAEFARSHWGLLAVFAASLAFRRKSLPGLLGVMFLAGLAGMVMVMRWWGASVNHFLGLVPFMIVECAVFFGVLLRERRMAWAALCLALVVPPLFAFSLPSGPDPCGFEKERRDVAELEGMLALLDGPVIMDAEGAYVFLGSELFRHLRLYDAFETDVYDQTGLWSLPDSRLMRDVRGRRAAAFVDSRVFMSQDLAWNVRAYYRETARIGRYSVFTPRPDMAVLDFRGLGGGCPDGSCLEVVEVKGLKNWGNYLQPEAGSGELVLKAVSDKPLGGFRVVHHPRFTGPDQGMTVSVSRDGASWQILDSLAFDGNIPGAGFENPRESMGRDAGNTLYLKFGLSGGAQLWVTPRRPLMAYFSGAYLTDGLNPK